MTEQNAALAFDRALDGEHGISLNGSESLVLTAHAMQTLFDRQQEIPTEEFVMQLEQTLFALPVVPTEVEGPPAGAVFRPQPTPRPTPIHPNRTRTFPRWAAIAAALILLFGGAGVISLGPFDLHSTPEPSAIPAIGFGTAEAAPSSESPPWTVAPLPGTSGSDKPPVIANGVAFRTFIGSNTSPVQAVDVQTGQELWSKVPEVAPDLIGATDDLLLVAGSNGKMAGFRYELIAIDGRTGEERWSEPLASAPAGLTVADNKIFVLGSDNLLEVFEPNTHQVLWQADLTRFVDSVESRVNTFTGFTGDRIALIGGTVGVIVGNGRLIGVDSKDGGFKWADARRTTGWTRLAVVDDKFVVTAFGPDKLMYDPAATPVPMTPSDPMADPCKQTIATRSGSTPSVADGIRETVDSFDPDTGASFWGLMFPEQYFVWPVDESRLIAQVEPVQSAGIANNDDKWFTCLIDGSTGAISETIGTEFTTFVAANPDTGGLVAFGALPSGVSLGIDIQPEEAESLPFLDLDPAQFGWFRWVQKTDNMILITGQDGTLIGLPANAAGRAGENATPTNSTPEAVDTGWTAHGPDGITDYAEIGIDHVIADGRIFRAFNMQIGGPTVQAIDADSGKVLWEAPAEVKDELNGIHMAVAGDMLLISGSSQLVALDVATGKEAWTAELSGSPVTMAVSGNRVLVLSDGDMLDAVDVETGQTTYSVSIQGDAQNLYPFSSFSRDHTGDEHRLAIDGDTIYAVLADGSVVAVDIDTGVAKWWSLRSTPGQVQVYAIDGSVVAVDQGDLADISATIEADSQAHRTGTPRAEASPSPISGIATCAGIESNASPAATPAPTTTLDGIVTTYRGLDADSGAVRWSMVLPAQSGGQVAVDVGVLYEVWASANWPTNQAQVAVCVVDPRTGAVRQIDNLHDLPGRTFLFERTSDPATWSIGIIIEDEGLTAVPAAFDPDITGPVITLDETFSDGWWWNEVYEGAIYFSLMNGDLVKIPIPAE